MNKYEYLVPVAVVAFGLWACGDDSTSSADCLTPDCFAQAGSSSDAVDFGLSSATVPDLGLSSSVDAVLLSSSSLDSAGQKNPDSNGSALGSSSSVAGPVVGSSATAPLSSAGPVATSSS